MQAERFLQKYRVLEGILEKRYEGEKLNYSSVVIEYLHDADSYGIRTELDLLREIRNLLSHNAGQSGQPVVEPSGEMLDLLDRVTEFVKTPRLAVNFGTPAQDILSAHPNDSLFDILRSMVKNGYSHVPVIDHGKMVGVLSTRSVFDHLAEFGTEGLRPDARIAQLGERIRLDRQSGERYLFIDADATILSVSRAFRRYSERDRRLSAVFVTEGGAPNEPLICMLTPWDVLGDRSFAKENDV